MRDYSEDDIGARALNWIMIGGAAVLFLLASLSSLAPLPGTQAPERGTTFVSTPAPHAPSVTG